MTYLGLPTSWRTHFIFAASENLVMWGYYNMTNGDPQSYIVAIITLTAIFMMHILKMEKDLGVPCHLWRK